MIIIRFDLTFKAAFSQGWTDLKTSRLFQLVQYIFVFVWSCFVVSVFFSTCWFRCAFICLFYVVYVFFLSLFSFCFLGPGRPLGTSRLGESCRLRGCESALQGFFSQTERQPNTICPRPTGRPQKEKKNIITFLFHFLATCVICFQTKSNKCKLLWKSYLRNYTGDT